MQEREKRGGRMSAPTPDFRLQSEQAIQTYLQDKALRDKGKGSILTPSCRLIAVDSGTKNARIQCAKGIGGVVDRIRAFCGIGGYSSDLNKIADTAKTLKIDTNQTPDTVKDVNVTFNKIFKKWESQKLIKNTPKLYEHLKSQKITVDNPAKFTADQREYCIWCIPNERGIVIQKKEDFASGNLENRLSIELNEKGNIIFFILLMT
jgi:hypothetical protein